MNNCNICPKSFSSVSQLYVHKREKHTFNNTKIIICKMCLKQFNSVLMKKNKFYEKCEDCRELIKKFKIRSSTNNNSIFYDKENMKRYLIKDGILIQKCIIFDCDENSNCNLHDQTNFIKCKDHKCNNCFIPETYNFCKTCRNSNFRSNDKFRLAIKNFKKELGGKCMMCGFNELFFLEFDHIVSKEKINQITRTSPKFWKNEIHNLQLLCGRCHRYKTFMENQIKNEKIAESRGKKHRNKKKNFLNNLKKKIGYCEICKWTSNNHKQLLCALDFDHLEKYNKIENLSKLRSISFMKEEVQKTRLICRHCHELYTCFQKGGKVLKFYYSDDEIEILRAKVCQLQ